jgi:hypothetical protein
MAKYGLTKRNINFCFAIVLQFLPDGIPMNKNFYPERLNKKSTPVPGRRNASRGHCRKTSHNIKLEIKTGQ